MQLKSLILLSAFSIALINPTKSQISNSDFAAKVDSLVNGLRFMLAKEIQVNLEKTSEYFLIDISLDLTGRIESTIVLGKERSKNFKYFRKIPANVYTHWKRQSSNYFKVLIPIFLLVQNDKENTEDEIDYGGVYSLNEMLRSVRNQEAGVFMARAIEIQKNTKIECRGPIKVSPVKK
jgi:hypothetical protein